jgi:hypothetical protein
MNARAVYLVVILTLAMNGCEPGSGKGDGMFNRTWTITSASSHDSGPESLTHIDVGDRFRLKKVGNDTVIQPMGGLATRWGFSEKPLTETNGVYCVEIDFGSDHEVVGPDTHSSHWFAFTLPGSGESGTLRIEYFPIQSEFTVCTEPDVHLGVAHAQD